MSVKNKKVLDYNANTSFGHFAEIMNNNAAIDMAENKLNAPMPVVNTGEFSQKSEAQSGGTQLSDAVDTAVNATEGASATQVETDITDSGSTETVTSTVKTAPTAQPIISTTSAILNPGTFDQWMSDNGYDPDRDYDDARAALEYDYQTSMATYGRRAEELAQMGLSNSGLSDIFQLNAYNSYLQQQNDLANKKIAAKKKYKQEYNDIYAQYEAGLQVDNANAYNFGLSLYDGENYDFVRQQLTNQGYSEEVVNTAMEKLTALGVDTLPTIKAQAEAEEADISNAVNTWVQNGYKSSMQGNVEKLYDSMDWSKEKINKLITRLNAFAGVINDEKINEAYKTYVGTYNPNNKAYLKATLEATDWTKEEIDELFKKLDSTFDAAATGAIDTTVEEATTISALSDAYEYSKNITDEETKTAKQEAISQKIGEQINGVVNNDANYNLEDVADFLKLNEGEGWGDKSDAEKEYAIINKAGELKRQGILSATDYSTILDNWITSEARLALEEDESNVNHTGFRDAGAIAYKLLEYKDAGYLSTDEYNEKLNQVIGKVGLILSRNSLIKWTVDGQEVSGGFDANATNIKYLHGDKYDAVMGVFNELKKRGIIENDDFKGYIVYEDDLYYFSRPDQYADPTIGLLDPEASHGMSGDWVSGETDVQRRGMFELYKALLWNKQTELERNNKQQSEQS